MERAARLIRKETRARNFFSDDDFSRAVWPAAVGKTIAAHTLRLRLVRNKLIVEVEDAIWQKQLFGLSGQILDRIRKVTGSELVGELEFRVGAPKREAGRAESPYPADESDEIRDPILKKVYQLSRKRAGL